MESCGIDLLNFLKWYIQDDIKILLFLCLTMKPCFKHLYWVLYTYTYKGYSNRKGLEDQCKAPSHYKLNTLKKKTIEMSIGMLILMTRTVSFVVKENLT